MNSLVHRDLSALARGTPVQVQLFPDRLTIMNPGGLHGPVSVDRLGEAGVSSSRNATMVRLLEDTPVPGEGYLVCENRGSGIGAMLAALRESGMSPPEFNDAVATFSVTFPNHTLFDRETLRWLGEIEIEFPTEASQILSEKATAILELLERKGELSGSGIAEALQFPGRTTRFWLKRLRNQGLIEPTAQNLRDPNLKYRLPR